MTSPPDAPGLNAPGLDAPGTLRGVNEWRLLFWPPTATRAESIARVPTAILLLGQPFFFALVSQAASSSRWADRHALLLSTLPIAAAVIAAAAWLLCWSRSKRLIQRTGLRLCPGCRYDLSACQTDGACPECGRRYTHDDLRRLWKAAYKL